MLQYSSESSRKSNCKTQVCNGFPLFPTSVVSAHRVLRRKGTALCATNEVIRFPWRSKPRELRSLTIPDDQMTLYVCDSSNRIL
jgi:hypothetical protein